MILCVTLLHQSLLGNFVALDAGFRLGLDTVGIEHPYVIPYEVCFGWVVSVGTHSRVVDAAIGLCRKSGILMHQ